MLREMVTRDKNRCGIIIRSLSNETAPSPARNKVLKNMAIICRSLDSTRLVSSAFDHFKYQGNKIIIDDEFSASLDVLAANKYMGWYTKWPSKPGNEVWESSFNKPLNISEFGGEALYGQHGPADDMSQWSEEYQEQLYKDNIQVFKGIPFLAGTCPWILIDFRTPFRMNLKYQNGWNRKGLLSDQGLNSILELYASWGVDCIKVDDLSRPYRETEVEGYRKAIENCGRRIVLSLSPGSTPITEAEHVAKNAKMWRLAGDFWDNWKEITGMMRQAKLWERKSLPATGPIAT